MAEFSAHWTTGAASGDSITSYTQAQNSTVQAVLAASNAFEGVAPGYLNSLAGTVTGANTVAINTGGAMVDGKIYHNGASVNVNIPSAVGGGNTRIDRVVLRCSWAAYTVRITRIAGTDAASPAAPAITQTSGTTYDILLYQALVTTAGAVTLTDERVWARGTSPTGDLTISNTGVAAIGSGVIVAADISNNVITATQLATPQTWVAVSSFTNSWLGVGGAYSAVAYYKDLLGIVHLRGIVNGGANGTVAFQLPAGYRPTGTLTFAVPSASDFNTVTVGSTGDVTCYLIGVDGWCGLSSITFSTH